jgi:hypothetical protein
VPLKIKFEFLGYDCLHAGHIYTSTELKCDRYSVILSLEIVRFRLRYLLRNTIFVFQFGHPKVFNLS